MSHELDMTNGAAIAYRGDVPWHGYGEAIETGDTLETIINKAKLDWLVNEIPVTYEFNGQIKTAKNRKLLVRSDSGELLNMVSESNYKVRQPHEIVEAFREMVDGKGFEIEVAGALQEGKKVWALAKRTDNVGELGSDIILPYVMLMDSYDGTKATTAMLTAIRVVCANTMGFAFSCDKQEKKSARQRHSQEFDANALFSNLGEFDENFAAYMETLKTFSKVKMTDESLQRFFGKLYAPTMFKDADNWTRSKFDVRGWDSDTEPKNKVSTNAQNVISRLLDLFNDNRGSSKESAEGTLFGALNTVTFYQDHEARTKGDKRWESATIGNGAKIKDSAYDLALEFVS